jgi:hypothetical protein
MDMANERPWLLVSRSDIISPWEVGIALIARSL